MSTVLDERAVLKKVNESNEDWAVKVDNMTEAQVNDATLKLMSQGKI